MRIEQVGGDPGDDRGRKTGAGELQLTGLDLVGREVREHGRAHRQLLGPGLTSPGLAPASQATTAPVTPVIVEQLSEREREVLRHVSGMLTTAEIASELYISINTVKSHLKNIYRKLAAGHRGEAVRRARQLELI